LVSAQTTREFKDNCRLLRGKLPSHTSGRGFGTKKRCFLGDATSPVKEGREGRRQFQGQEVKRDLEIKGTCQQGGRGRPGKPRAITVSFPRSGPRSPSSTEDARFSPDTFQKNFQKPSEKNWGWNQKRDIGGRRRRKVLTPLKTCPKVVKKWWGEA